MTKKILFFSLILLIFSSCTDDDTKEGLDKTKKLPYANLLPTNNTKLICGDPLPIKFEVVNGETIASIQILLNDSLITEKSDVTGEIKTTIDTKNLPVGYHKVKIVLTDKEGKEHLENRTVILFSDVFPDIMVAKIIKEYPHLTTNYTQGLEYYKGKLYEGTGQTGSSKLAEIDLQTGAIVRKVDLPNYMFGEGITILNDEVYQITWEDRKCFVYDVNTFEKKREYQYFGEGWGITNDGKNLIMSNGSSEITFRNPKTFEKIRSIYVFGSSQEYVLINELEYHQGYIYANVYQENFILKIDPANGKVLAKIDCIEAVQRGKGTGDVLNGIAFNDKTGNFIITGKNWPKMFEVQFVEP